jgi:hypothetical protein
MITKQLPASSDNVPYGYWVEWGSSGPWRSRLNQGADLISYEEGPIYANRHCNWKICHHEEANRHLHDGSWTWLAERGGTQFGFRDYFSNFGFSGNCVAPAAQPDYSTCFTKIMDQIDLNSTDNVLLYSGILQAVPLVGGAFKFVSVMNRAARKLSKSFKKKPFTTVVKSLIQMDFIDRFVVSPTIDDARKFLDASNYVLRVLNTMQERNAMPVRYEGETSDLRVSKKTGRSPFPYSNSDVRGDKYLYFEDVTSIGSVSKMFLLAEVAYNTTSVSPIQLWATRCGLTRPLDSIWDLVPFSFVIDYFSRSGDFISGLGDEISSQDGLRGRVQKVYGCWGTCLAKNEIRRNFIHHGNVSFSGGRVVTDNFKPFSVSRRSSSFDRIPLNPWHFLKPFDNGFLKWEMSSTRYRTLLELWIQAKL